MRNRMLDRTKSGLAAFWREEDGLGTLELLLILAVIVVIAIAFRKWIMRWVGALFHSANTEIDSQTNLNGDGISPPSPSATP